MAPHLRSAALLEGRHALLSCMLALLGCMSLGYHMVFIWLSPLQATEGLHKLPARGNLPQSKPVPRERLEP